MNVFCGRHLGCMVVRLGLAALVAAMLGPAAGPLLGGQAPPNPPPLSDADKASAPKVPMAKSASQEASFITYTPAGWTTTETSSKLYRTVLATDPSGQYEVEESHGNALADETPEMVAARFIAERAKTSSGLALSRAMKSADGARITYDGVCTCPKRGKREFRAWSYVGGEGFVHTRVEGPEGKLAAERQMLITVLANFRVTKGAFEYAAPAPIQVTLVPYRLSDGSASFVIPQGWNVTDLGRARFLAADPGGGGFSFIVSVVEVLSPRMGVYVPTAIASPYLSPHEAMEFLAKRQGFASDLKFLQVNRRLDLQQQMALVYTVGPVQVEDFLYTCTTRSGRTKVYSLGYTFGTRLDTGWSFWHLTVGAPEGQFDAFIPNFIAMLQSYKIDDEYAGQYVRRGIENLRRLQAQTSALIARNAQEIHQMMTDCFNERMRSWDYIDYQRTNTIRGQQDWVSAVEGGTVYHSDSWGATNTETGEFWPGKAYDYVHFKGQNPKYNEMMTSVDSRALWEQHVEKRPPW